MVDALDAARAQVTAALARVPVGSVKNGTVVVNTARPLSTTLDDWMKLTVNEGKTALADVVSAITYIMGANAEQLDASRPNAKVAAHVVLGRMATMRSLSSGDDAAFIAECNPLEVHVLGPLAPHASHKAAIVEAIGLATQYCTRALGIFAYNALSIAICNHIHTPRVTRHLASTTYLLSPYQAATGNRMDNAGPIMHCMFHPFPASAFSEACRSKKWKQATIKLGYSNLTKRIPIKATDTAIAMNYRALYTTASGYTTRGVGIPAKMGPTAAMTKHIAQYAAAVLRPSTADSGETGPPAAVNADAVKAENIQAPAASVDASETKKSEPSAYPVLYVDVAEEILRADSLVLRVPAAILVGYLHGCLCQAHDDDEMSLKEAHKVHKMTILGSPAFGTLASAADTAGSYAIGLELGKVKPTKEQLRGALMDTLSRGAALVSSIV